MRWEHDIKISHTKINREVGRLIELAEDRVQWPTFVLTVLSLRVLPPEN